MKYLKALKARKPVTVIPDGVTREHAAEAIREITEELRGPMSNAERVMLVHDRQDWRDILALLEQAADVAGSPSSEAASTP